LLSFLGALGQRRAALEQQRDDIEAVLKEISRFELQCRDMLKTDQAAAEPGPKKVRRS
jgi:hypothetical protein